MGGDGWSGGIVFGSEDVKLNLGHTKFDIQSTRIRKDRSRI